MKTKKIVWVGIIFLIICSLFFFRKKEKKSETDSLKVNKHNYYEFQDVTIHEDSIKKIFNDNKKQLDSALQTFK